MFTIVILISFSCLKLSVTATLRGWLTLVCSMCREIDRRNGIGSRRYRGDREDRDYLRSEEREKRRREVAAARRMPMDDGDLLEELRARAFETGAPAPHCRLVRTSIVQDHVRR